MSAWIRVAAVSGVGGEILRERSRFLPRESRNTTAPRLLWSVRERPCSASANGKARYAELVDAHDAKGAPKPAEQIAPLATEIAALFTESAGGVWLDARMQPSVHFFAPHERGWAKRNAG